MKTTQTEDQAAEATSVAQAGGVKKTRGRVALDGVTVRRAQVMLDEETAQRAKALGDGNISMGLRKAVKGAVLEKYIIHELRNGVSVRKGEVFEGTLRGAKLKATREQVSYGTVMQITDEDGRAVAIKDRQIGKWSEMTTLPMAHRSAGGAVGL